MDFCTVLTWQLNFPCSLAWKDVFFLVGLSFRFCLKNYSVTLLRLLLLNFPSVPLCRDSFGRGTKCSLRHCNSRITIPVPFPLESPARFHITEKSWVFRATDLSELPVTLLIDKDVHSSSFSCFLNGTKSFVGQKSFQDHEAALRIGCGISSD